MCVRAGACGCEADYLGQVQSEGRAAMESGGSSDAITLFDLVHPLRHGRTHILYVCVCVCARAYAPALLKMSKSVFRTIMQE